MGIHIYDQETDHQDVDDLLSAGEFALYPLGGAFFVKEKGEAQIQLGLTAQQTTDLQNALSAGDNVSELVNDANYQNNSQVSSSIQTAIDNLVNGAPGALDTLNELANALGNDANFAATVASQQAAQDSAISQNTSDISSGQSSILTLQDNLNLLSYADSEVNTTGLVNNTTTEAVFMTLNANVPANGEYRIDWSYLWSLNNGADDIIVRLKVNGVNIWENVQEPKDTAGAGVVLPNTTGGTTNTETNQRHLASAHEIITLNSGSNTIELTLDASVGGSIAAIYRGVISIEKFGLS